MDFRFLSSTQEPVLNLLPGEYQISRNTRSWSCNYYSWINPVFEAENSEFGEICKFRLTKFSTTSSMSNLVIGRSAHLYGLQPWLTNIYMYLIINISN